MRHRDAFMFRSIICRFHLKTDKVRCTNVIRCNINDVKIPHALCIKIKHSVLRHQFQTRVIWYQKTTMG